MPRSVEIKRSTASMTRRPKSLSGDDVPVRAGLVGVGGYRFIGLEVQIALDGEPELAANGPKFH